MITVVLLLPRVLTRMQQMTLGDLGLLAQSCDQLTDGVIRLSFPDIDLYRRARALIRAGWEVRG
jgi:hypothetical protein